MTAEIKTGKMALTFSSPSRTLSKPPLNAAALASELWAQALPTPNGAATSGGVPASKLEVGLWKLAREVPASRLKMGLALAAKHGVEQWELARQEVELMVAMLSPWASYAAIPG